MNKPLILHPKQLFLLDSAGALLTTILLSLVLANLEHFFGIPAKILYPLAAIAGIFAIYSFTCYLRVRQHWKPYLQIIALANLLYCVLTISLLIYFRQEITRWGVLYFLLEVVIVVFLASIEWRTATTKDLHY